MKGKVLITGASGFIGTHVVEMLLEKGFGLVLTTRNVDRTRHLFSKHPDIDIVSCKSILSDGGLEDIRSVVHLAGLAHAPQAIEEQAFQDANNHGTAQLVRMARQSKVPLFIHMSSIAAVTGHVSDQVIDDTTVPAPTTAYGRSKLAAESHVASLAQNGVCAVSLRPPLVVGHNAPGNWARLQRLVRSGLPLPFGAINNMRSMASIDLLVQVVTALCEQPPDAKKSGNYCVANPSAISLAEVVKELRAGMGMSARLLPFPTSLFGAIGRLSGKRQLVDSLIGDLVLDSSRLFKSFPIQDALCLHASIRKSGQLYRFSATRQASP